MLSGFTSAIVYKMFTMKRYNNLLLLAIFSLSLLFVAFARGDIVHFLNKLVFAQRNSLQLEPYVPPQDFINTIGRAWLSECKPAIYLYPEEKTTVHVRVEPKGYFTLTIPEYPKEGWVIKAEPGGELSVNGQIYPYLYYESKLFRSEVSSPSKGFAVPYEELSEFFADVLPKLGLNEKESTDFVDYWTKALPKSPYYFVGLVERSDIDQIEKLTIDPIPDSVNRIRFFFKPLETPVAVEPPPIDKQERYGFSVVEWGGVVDLSDKDFVCSQ